MDRAREQLLAGAALADQQYGDRRPCGARSQLEHGIQAAALGEDAVVAKALADGRRGPAGPPARPRCIPGDRQALERAPAERLAHHEGHAAEIAAFLHDVVRGPELHGVDGHVLRSSAGDDDDGDRRVPGPDDPEAVEAGGVREAVVEEDAVDAAGGQMLERLPDRGHRDDLESSGRRERSSDQLRGLGVVLNEEDRRRHGGGLSRIR